MSASPNSRAADHLDTAHLDALRQNLRAEVLGSDSCVELLLVALLARGHVLIQGAPGMGKTTLAKTLAGSINCGFKRIQFTPDLLPADILGYSIYDQQEAGFVFYPGPVFTNVLLADEINRATPRIQSALLEAMSEKQVSVDGVTRSLDDPFFVIATQNSIHATGTFPLPESQLDRFLLSFSVERPSLDTQEEILQLHLTGEIGSPRTVIETAELVACQQAAAELAVSRPITQYIARLVDATHNESRLVSGVSSRGALALLRASQAHAFLARQPAVYPDGVKRLAPHVFAHRLNLRGRRHSNEGVNEVIRELLDAVPVP